MLGLLLELDGDNDEAMSVLLEVPSVTGLSHDSMFSLLSDTSMLRDSLLLCLLEIISFLVIKRKSSSEESE